jgi:hypothetical protein
VTLIRECFLIMSFSRCVPQVEKLLKERNAKEVELQVLLKTEPKSMWNNDLDVFLKHWEVCILAATSRLECI